MRQILVAFLSGRFGSMPLPKQLPLPEQPQSGTAMSPSGSGISAQGAQADSSAKIQLGVRTVVLLPGRNILLEALAHQIAHRFVGYTGQLRYGLKGASDFKVGDSSALNPGGNLSDTWCWIDWNDSAQLERLLRDPIPSQLIPVEIFERRGPARSNPRYRFGLLRSLELFLMRRRSTILFSNPILVGGSNTEAGNTEADSGNSREASDTLSLPRLIRLLKVQHSRALRLVRGVPFQSMRATEQQVLNGPDFERELGILSLKNKQSVEQVRELARREFRTIAANPVRWIFAASATIARIIVRSLFSDVRLVGVKQFTDAAQDAAVVLVPMHRSHLDYILVGSVLYESRVNTPVVAAGLNLSFWPVGPLIRSLGAYFVKRNSRNDRIHSLVLKRYVSYLTKRGHLQEFFIEGGRSRSGRMRSPKLGLLNIMVDACAKGLRRELLFIPVSISYENVVEDRALAEENTGVSKRSESLADFLALPRIFKKSYGEVVIQFGRPLSLSTMLRRVNAGKISRETIQKPTGGQFDALREDNAQKSTGVASTRAPRIDTKVVVRELAATLTRRLRDQSSLSLSGLVCTSLLCSPRYGLRISELTQRLLSLVQLARIVHLQTPDLGELSLTLERFVAKPETLRSVLSERVGIFEITPVIDDEVVRIPGKQRYLADFYRNSVQHVFFPVALALAVRHLSGDAWQQGLEQLHALLEHEYMLPPWEEFTDELRRTLQALADEGLLTLHTSESATSTVPQIVKVAHQVSQLGLECLVLVPLESMLWVAERLMRSDCELGSTRPFKDFVREAQGEFRAATYRGSTVPSRTESGSQSNIIAGLELLATLGCIEIQEGASGPATIVIRKKDSSELRLFTELGHQIYQRGLMQTTTTNESALSPRL